MNGSMRQRGFTLPELILVIVITGVIAGTLTVFLRPAIEGWVALRVRADLTDQASAALHAMKRDVRVAVPNSIRTPNAYCFELVPTTAGGRFRKELDSTDAANTRALDLNAGSTQFDVLSPLASTPAAGDQMVVDNQNPGDVYAGTIRASISAVDPTVVAGKRQSRITLGSAINDSGYTGGRFVVVSAAQASVFYVCSGAGESNGDGTGTLYRVASATFNAAYPMSCPSTAGAAVLATRVKSCRFVYSPNAGATQQSGFVSMQLELARNNETVSLLLGAHVMNAP
jgi:MSHA biogenesis protein MshO